MSDAKPPKLQWRAVSFAYRGCSRLALDGVDFHVGEGELVAVIGPTGAGKSTLIRCGSGIVPKFFKGRFAGEIAVEGELIAGMRVADLAGKVGTVFQDFESQLFSTNVRLECAFGMENLGVDRETMIGRIERIGRLTGISGLMDREPQSLSGGQKQRLAMASVLCLDPDVLLCDEPATDLDPEGRRDLFALLRRLRELGHSIGLVEHETERLLDADRIVVLREGRIVAEGRPAEVLGDVDFCAENGIHAPQLFELFSRLGLPERPSTVEEAEAILRHGGFSVVEGPEYSGDSVSGPPLIAIEDLRFSYLSGEEVLKGVSLGIKEGEMVAVLGSNGSGKTTLVKHMNGLLRAVSGSVLIEGEPIERIGTAGMGRRVGFVFQNPDHMLFAESVFEEVAFGLRNYGFSEAEIPERVKGALDAVGLSGVEAVDPFVMTKGDRQKLAVACVLACEPKVLILDEPTTGLDATEQLRMMELLRGLNRVGHTIVMITHSMEVAARYAGRSVLMASGTVIADLPTREAFSRPDLLSKASLEAPPCTRLGERFGLSALTMEELASRLERKTP